MEKITYLIYIHLRQHGCNSYRRQYITLPRPPKTLSRGGKAMYLCNIDEIMHFIFFPQACHSFSPNAGFYILEHPRFGKIMSIKVSFLISWEIENSRIGRRLLDSSLTLNSPMNMRHNNCAATGSRSTF